MPRLYFNTLQIDGGATKEIEEQGGQLKIEPHLLDQLISGSLEPDKVFSLGNKISGKVWITEETLAEMGIQLNVSGASLTINSSEAVVLGVHGVVTTVEMPDGTTDTYTMTAMVFTQNLDMSIKMGDKYYLALEFKSTKSSTLVIAQA